MTRKDTVEQRPQTDQISHPLQQAIVTHLRRRLQHRQHRTHSRNTRLQTTSTSHTTTPPPRHAFVTITWVVTIAAKLSARSQGFR